MSGRFKPFWFVAQSAMLTLTLLVLLAGQPVQPIQYELSYDPASQGSVEVTITLPDDATVLVMPRAVPMGYSDVHYDRFLRDVEATGANGTPLTVTRERLGPRWKLGDGTTPARRVRYTVAVDAMERELLSASDTSKARSGYVGLLGYSIFAYPEGLENHPVELSVQVPQDWPVFLTLAPRVPPPTGTATAAAALAEEGGLGDAYREELADRRFRTPLAASPTFLTELDLVQVSRIASTRYSEDFRTGRNVFARGGLMAYEIDDAIRAGTNNKKSLLDLLPELCLEETGVDVGEIYSHWLGRQSR